MAVKVDEHISSPLSLKPIQVLKPTLSQKWKYMKWFSISFHFFPPLRTNFHNRCGASRSSLLMKCKVVELGLSPDLLLLSTSKWVKEEQRGLCDGPKSASILRVAGTKEKQMEGQRHHLLLPVTSSNSNLYINTCMEERISSESLISSAKFSIQRASCFCRPIISWHFGQR